MVFDQRDANNGPPSLSDLPRYSDVPKVQLSYGGLRKLRFQDVSNALMVLLSSTL